MKYTLTILLILVTSIALAQTRPHWLQLQGTPISDVRSYGVKGDGVTDDYVALKAAIEAGGTVVIPDGLTILVRGLIAGDATTGIPLKFISAKWGRTSLNLLELMLCLV